jgi:hypothetical protein
MPQVILPSIRDSDSPELQYQYLYDAYIRLTRELSFLLENLDSDNVYNITTDKLIAGEAKISTALIEDLIVGGNVAMGPNATIAWSKVTGANAGALAAWENSGYATYINANGVYSGSFNGGMFNINPTGDRYLESGLTIGGYQGSSWKGEALKVQYDEHGFFGGFPATVVSSAGGADLVFDVSVEFTGNVYGLNDLNYASVNHNHGNDYVKSYTGQNLSLVATETGIAVRVNGVTLGSIFYD